MGEVPTIKMEALEKQLKELNDTQIEGFSIMEMSSALSKTTNWCRTKLKSLMVAGKAKYTGVRPATRIDGRACLVPVYILLK